MNELSGDQPLTPGQRMSWLFGNLRRNWQGGKGTVRTIGFPDAPALGGPLSSPGRMFTDHAFLRLLSSVPRSECDVLEIGCGSGSLCRRLAALGFTGRYTGIDIGDRFDTTPVAGFAKSFVRADARTWTPPGRFHLIVSVSALEHIPDDASLVARLRSWLHAGGSQVHIVPAPWSLPLYLWHGYRQYSRAALAARFPGERTVVYRLGGAISFIVHFMGVTLPELLLRRSVRKAFPGLYRRALDLCRFDVRLGCRPANLYAVVERAP